jgi:hypothetical protein
MSNSPQESAKSSFLPSPTASQHNNPDRAMMQGPKHSSAAACEAAFF